jgi:GntR family transcriptional repressor for pyruvate dehydrogenase complex
MSYNIPNGSTAAMDSNGKPVKREMRSLRRTYLYEKVSEEIRDYILENGLTEGDRLPSEQELCAMLGVSRTPLREGLRLLQLLGVIESKVGEGTFVRDLDLDSILTHIAPFLRQDEDDLLDLMEVRGVLEIQAFHLAIKRVSPENLAEMRQALEATRAKFGTEESCVEEDMAFHRAIFKAAGNKVLLRLLDAMTDFLRDVRREGIKVTGVETIYEHHKMLYDVLCEGDEEKAVVTMRAHLNRATKEMLEALALNEQKPSQ